MPVFQTMTMIDLSLGSTSLGFPSLQIVTMQVDDLLPSKIDGALSLVVKECRASARSRSGSCRGSALSQLVLQHAVLQPALAYSETARCLRRSFQALAKVAKLEIAKPNGLFL